MHTYSHRTSAHYKEARLCKRTGPGEGSRASESLGNKNQLEINPHLKSLIASYDTTGIRTQYPELQNPIDRTNFFTLLLHKEIASDDTDFSTLTRDSLDPINVLPIPDDLTHDPERGEWLKKSLSPELLEELDPQYKTLPPEKIASLYAARVSKAKEKWKKDGTVTDQLLVRIPIEQYRDAKKVLNEILQKQRLQLPGIESRTDDLKQHVVTRDEYMHMLALVAAGDIGTAAKQAELLAAGDRSMLKGGIDHERIHTIYTDIASKELGPEESLHALGLTIPPDVRHAYLDMVQGKTSGDFASLEGDTLPAGTIADSAAIWEAHPDRAYFFLADHPPAGPAAAKFMESLRFHYVMTPEEKAAVDASAILSIEDTRALLRSISQSLLETEQVVRSTREFLTKKEKEVTGEKNIEKIGADVWEYMTDLRSHPIGTALAWLAAFIAGKMLWKFATGEHKRITGLLGIGAIGGLAVGLYQQHKTGKAWWESAAEGINDWMGKEKAKEPEDQTMPNYWMDELALSSEQDQICMAVLHDQELGTTMDWYAEMAQWKAKGSPRGEQPAFPMRLSSGLRKHFGGMKNQEIALAMYQVLEQFFTNRGRKVRSELPEFDAELDIKGDADLGYAYIRERYLEQRYYHSIIAGIAELEGVEIDGRLIEEWDPSDVEAIRKKIDDPVVFARLVELREAYIAEVKAKPSASWPMMYIFMLEANPEILRRSKRDGVQPADFLERFADSAKELGEDAAEKAKQWYHNGVEWIETTGLPLAEKAVIYIKKGVNIGAEKTKEFMAKAPDLIKKFPGIVVEYTGTAVRWLDEKRVLIGEFAYETWDDFERSIYEQHGIPPDKLDAFKGNAEYLKSKHGLDISVLGTKQVVIGTFMLDDFVPFEEHIPGLPEDVFKLELPPLDFANANSPMIDAYVKEWKEKAFQQKKNSFDVHTLPKLEATISRDLTTVYYDNAGVITQRAQSPLIDFLRTSVMGIQNAFETWMADTTKPASDVDPLNR